MDFFERMQTWRSGFTWKKLLIFLLLLPLEVGRRLLEDRFDEKLNKYIDKHSDTALSLLAQFAKYLLTHPVGAAAIFALLILATLLLHAYIDTRPDKQRRGSLEETKKEDAKNNIESGEKLDLELTPSYGQSPKQLLAVKNIGKKQKFHAQCRLVKRRNDDNMLHKKSYDLAWERDLSRETTLATGESCNLQIAVASHDRATDLAEAKLLGLSNGSIETAEFSRWYESDNKPRPETDLEISVFGEDYGSLTELFTLKCGGKLVALEMTAAKQQEFPERGDYHRSTSMSRTNPDGSISIEISGDSQLDRRPQMWKELAGRFKEIDNKPIQMWAEWIYTFETKQYQWWIKHPSENAVKLCLELCKEAGRLLLAEQSFQRKFHDIAAVIDDGDRWLLAIYKITGIGKIRAQMKSASYGVEQNAEAGEIKDLPGASQVLCQMAVNGF
jgi:hypothetical protein